MRKKIQETKQDTSSRISNEERWRSLVEKIANRFEVDSTSLEIDTILFLIGIQELNHVHRQYSKDDKLYVMHVAVCKLLEPYGYYQLEQIDEQGWPQYKLKKKLPPLKTGEQTILMKESIVEYFLKHGYID